MTQGALRLTAALPGTGGSIRATPEDFEVEEIPAYTPSGQGEHLFLFVEKVGIDTPEAALRIASALGLRLDDVSWAGLKDRVARTRQWLCVPARAEVALPQLAPTPSSASSPTPGTGTSCGWAISAETASGSASAMPSARPP